MTTYKDVMVLAEEKGYKLDFSVDLVNEDIQFYHNPETSRYIDLCLMQQWLRDDHNIRIGIDICYGDGAYSAKLHTIGANERHPSEFSFKSQCEFHDTYEQALMEGINEALKLI